MLWKRSRDDAVSEIVGNLLILMITVALFSVVLGFVYSIPGPEATLQAEIVPMLERTSAVDGTLHLQHTGGEALKEGETYILVSIDDTPTQYKISDGLGGKKVMEPGDTWSMDFLGTISTSSKIDVKIVDVTSNSLLFYTVVQRGVSAGGDHDPIIAYAWVDTTTGVDIIPNNDYTTWRIYAVCKDIDGDLPPTGSVSAAVTSTDNGDGTFTVTNFGAGSTDLTDNRGDGVFMTGLLKVSTSVLPGDYSFIITATDDTGRTATATVTITVSTSQSSIRVVGTDESPEILKAGQTNKVFLKLEFLANGESININQIRVTKLGTIPDNKVSIHAYWDKNRNDILEIGTDYDLPGYGYFSSGRRDFIGSPLFTAIEDEPTSVWLVISVLSGTEGNSIGVRIESQERITPIGVSTPIRIPPIGSFPIDSDILTIKGVFKVYGYNRHPTRILTGTDNVRMIELAYIATGETVFIEQINLTLLGTIATTELTCYLRDEVGVQLTGDLSFNPATRRLEIIAPVGGWRVDKSWDDYRINVYFNIAGNNGDTVGVQVDTEGDTVAETEISHDTINPQAPSGEPIPSSPDMRTLQSAGYVTLYRYGSTTMPTRAGGESYQRRWLFRCWGEPIEFYSIKVTLLGTIPYDRVTGMRIRVYSSYPVAQSYDRTLPFAMDRTVTFEHAVAGTPMWTVSMNSDFYGYIYIDSYVYLDHGTEGMTVQTGIAMAADIVCEGQITSTSITVQPYSSGHIPAWSELRTINGQLYVHSTSLIPSPLVSESQNIPVFKLTLKCEGQDVRINSLRLRKLGTVAQNLVTVRIYWDVNNDTQTEIGADDVEIDPTHAGAFVDNRIDFLPNVWITMGVDYNIVVVFSLGLGTAGWSLGCHANANEVGTSTNAPNWQSAFPNECLNVTRNPPIPMSSDTVPIRDRGDLHVYFEDLSPPNPITTVPYSWMKLTFWAEGENVDVNRIHFTVFNSSGSAPADFDRLHIYIFHDVNNNSAWNFGIDDIVDHKYFTEDGDATFFAFPLFNVKQREAYNLVVAIIPDNWSEGNFTLEVNTTGDIQSRGQVSGQSVSPIAPFPLQCIEREVT